MARVLVAYATRTGETRKIAELIAEGIRFTGVEAKVANVNDLKDEAGLEGYDACVLGSATYHGEMMQEMKTLLFLAEKVNLQGKPGGSFGAFGWSGEAPDRIYETMKNIFMMDMVPESLRLKSSAMEGGMQMAQGYGREIGKNLVEPHGQARGTT